MNTKDQYDVIIVGGSYAGLSAAMALGRSRRKVLIIDSGEPCNAQTPHSHNFLTQDGIAPAEIARVSKTQVLRYPSVSFLQGKVIRAERDANFRVTTVSGEVFHSSKILLATGVKDIFPALPGLKECWGISVLHCPYCHGYEVADSRLAVLAKPETAVEYVTMLLNWSKDIVLLTNGDKTLSEDARQSFKGAGVKINESEIKEIIHTNGNLKAISFLNDENLSVDAMFTRLPFEHHTQIANELGCDFTETNHIKTDEFGKTNVPGVYAAGDCVTPGRSVSIAVGLGTKAGISINRELTPLI